MLYRKYLVISIFYLLSNCTTIDPSVNNQDLIIKNIFKNKGFALIYNEDLHNNKIISKKIDQRSLVIFQKNLERNVQVKIRNILNNKSLIATVGKQSDYPSFNNSVISKRIATDLSIDINEPYIEITEISKNSLFIAKKAKMYDEEKSVADKAPVKNISINNLNKVKEIQPKIIDKNFLYTIKIADFYFRDTALLMVKRINTETIIKKVHIKKISDKKYRVYLGPFDSIISLQNSYNDVDMLEFENIEIMKND